MFCAATNIISSFCLHKPDLQHEHRASSIEYGVWSMELWEYGVFNTNKIMVSTQFWSKYLQLIKTALSGRYNLHLAIRPTALQRRLWLQETERFCASVSDTCSSMTSRWAELRQVHPEGWLSYVVFVAQLTSKRPAFVGLLYAALEKLARPPCVLNVDEVRHRLQYTSPLLI